MTESGSAPARNPVLVVGLGSVDRGDDAVGPAIAEQVATALRSGGLPVPERPPLDSNQVRDGFGVADLDGVAIRSPSLDGNGRDGGDEGEDDGGRADVVTLADPTALIDLLDGRALVVVVDAVRRGAAPGSVLVLPAGSADPLPGVGTGATSTHGLGLAEVLSLARALDVLPERLVVVGVEADHFEAGTPMSPAVAAALPDAVAAVLELIAGSA